MLSNRKRKQIKGRAGFSMLELIFVIIVGGVLAAVAAINLTGQSEKVDTSLYTGQINTDISTAMSLYKRSHYLSNGKYSVVDAEKMFMFLPDATQYTLDTVNNRISHNSLGGYYFQVIPDVLNANNDIKYKVYFDGSALKSNNGWDANRAKQLEAEIANYWSNASGATGIIAGDATALGAANTNATVGAIDGDLKILIGGCGN